MKRVIFEIIKACLLGMLFLCVGLYLGTMNERKEQEAGNKQYETVETIAVVNMDEGSDIDGEMINYGSELGAFPSENFVGASLDEAKSGIYNGTYGAYIVIPPTFSESVESINDFPQKASLTYSMNPNLSDATKLIVTDEIGVYMSLLNDTLSYVYVTSIMEEFHDVQDGSKTILEHDTQDLNNILAIVPSELSEDIEYPELAKADYSWEFLDLSEYRNNTEQYINNIDTYYDEVNTKMITQFGEVASEAAKAAEGYKGVQNQIQDFNPFADDTNGKNVLDNGFEKLEAEALLTDDTSMKNAIDTKVSEQAQIEMGYYREKLQEYVDEELNKYIATQQKSLNEYWVTRGISAPQYLLPRKSTAKLDEDYTKILSDAVDAPFVSDDIKDGKLEIGNYNHSTADIATDHPLLVKPETELSEAEKTERDALVGQLKNNTAISNRFKNNTFEIVVPSRNTIKTILSDDVAAPAEQIMSDQLNGIDSQLDGVYASINEEYEKIKTYNPQAEISASTAKENVNGLRTEISQMQMTVNEKTMNDTEAVNDIYMKSQDNISALKESMKTANSNTKTNVQNTIDTLKEAREGINSENTEILEAFSERLSYTRLGTLENEQAYDFIVEPIEYTREETQKTIAERVADDKMQLLIISIVSGVAYIACVIAGIVIALSKKKALSVPLTEEDE